MSTSTSTQLDQVITLLSDVEANVSAEIKQLADAIAASGGNLNAEQIAKFESIKTRLSAMVAALRADDSPTPPVTEPVDPTALQAAINDAINVQGATMAQLQPVTDLQNSGNVVTKSSLATALTALLDPSFNGGAPAAVAQVAALTALTV